VIRNVRAVRTKCLTVGFAWCGTGAADGKWSTEAQPNDGTREARRPAPEPTVPGPVQRSVPACTPPRTAAVAFTMFAVAWPNRATRSAISRSASAWSPARTASFTVGKTMFE
jgi:hypothetical protein